MGRELARLSLVDVALGAEGRRGGTENDTGNSAARAREREVYPSYSVRRRRRRAIRRTCSAFHSLPLITVTVYTINSTA
jgi:hypothetical protein